MIKVGIIPCYKSVLQAPKIAKKCLDYLDFVIFIDDLCKQLNHLINTKNYGQLVDLNNKYKISIKELASIIKEFEKLTNNINMQENIGDLKKNLYKTYLSFKN